jgi:predicted dehydrogenase
MVYQGALIGCGYISRKQLWAWKQIETVNIVAVCDLEVEKAKQRAQEFGIAGVYTDYSRMMDQEALDFVDIATRPGTHLDLVTAAADRRLDVLCQKPLAATLAEARRMVAACQKAGVTFMVNENARHQAWFRQLKKLLDEGALGVPHYARFEERSRSSLPTPTFYKQPYFQEMPRLIVYEMGIHYLDTARYLFGEAETVYACIRRVSPHIAGEDLVVLLVTFGDLDCLVDVNWYSVTEPGPKVAWGPMRVEGRKGTARLGRDGVLTLYTDHGQHVWNFPEDTIDQSFVAAQTHFIECLETGQEPETSGAETLITMSLVFAAYRSASERRLIQIGDVLSEQS